MSVKRRSNCRTSLFFANSKTSFEFMHPPGWFMVTQRTIIVALKPTCTSKLIVPIQKFGRRRVEGAPDSLLTHSVANRRGFMSFLCQSRGPRVMHCDKRWRTQHSIFHLTENKR